MLPEAAEKLKPIIVDYLREVMLIYKPNIIRINEIGKSYLDIIAEVGNSQETFIVSLIKLVIFTENKHKKNK